MYVGADTVQYRARGRLELDMKNEDNLKNEDDIKNEDDLKMKMTSKISCKDDCTLTKHAWHWTYPTRDFEIPLCPFPPLRSFLGHILELDFLWKIVFILMLRL